MRGFQIFMLIIGIALIIYAIVLFFIPTAEKRRIVAQKVKTFSTSERFVRKDD